MSKIAYAFLAVLPLLGVLAAPQTAQVQAAGLTPALVEPTILFQCDAASYYRPVVSADGAYVIFEMTPKDGGATILVIDTLSQKPPTNCSDHPPVPFVSKGASDGSQRPDWCWNRSAGGAPKNGPVAFSNGSGIFYASPAGKTSVPAALIPNTAGMIYPSWYPDCKNLAVDVSGTNPKVNGIWFGAKIDLYGNVIASPLAGTVWTGFPSVNQQSPNLVAFAGQANGKLSGTANYYNQDINYTWVADGKGNAAPLEQQINVNSGFTPIFQARAGSWSPDGKWFAFESNRVCKDVEGNTYAIFIIDSGGQHPMQVSACANYNVQHPKWYPAGSNGVSTALIAAVAPVSTGGSQFSIGKFDVANFLGSN